MEKAQEGKLKKRIFLLAPLAFILIGLVLFLPAGSLDYWQAWLYLGVLFIPFTLVIVYFLKRDPGLLERRMRFKEKEAQQKKIINLATLFFLIGFLMPGLDHRYGWSHVPAVIVILSDIMIVLGYLLIFLVFKENSYASRIVEVEKGQKVITTGPYSVIRHPMYAGVILMYIFTPLALGSFWALVFFVPVIPTVILRTLNEEAVLSRGLKGYKEYMKKVRYRLIPYVW